MPQSIQRCLICWQRFHAHMYRYNMAAVEFRINLLFTWIRLKARWAPWNNPCNRRFLETEWIKFDFYHPYSEIFLESRSGSSGRSRDTFWKKCCIILFVQYKKSYVLVIVFWSTASYKNWKATLCEDLRTMFCLPCM